jgi:hypoxanthine phosphoribosyltransferase
MLEDIERILIDEETIRRELRRLAAELVKAFKGRDLLVIAVLKGSCVFASDLIRLLPLPLSLEFLSASSYGDGTESSGAVNLRFFSDDVRLSGRAVLLVDDILDTGRTLKAVKDRLSELGADSVRTCVFLDKAARRAVDLQADFRCFQVEDVFVVGYGLDYAGRYRNLPYIASLRPEVYGGAAKPNP